VVTAECRDYKCVGVVKRLGAGALAGAEFHGAVLV